MLRILLVFASILLSGPLGSAAVKTLDGCEAHLGTDLFYGAFAKGLAAGRVGDDELAIACESSEPVNPLANATRTTRNGHLKDIFAAYVKLESVRKQWPQTQVRLRALRDSRQQTQAMSQAAAVKTRKVLAPHEHIFFPTRFKTVAPVTLNDGTHAIAHIAKEKIILSNIETKDVIGSVDAPKRNAKTSVMLFSIFPKIMTANFGFTLQPMAGIARAVFFA